MQDDNVTIYRNNSIIHLFNNVNLFYNFNSTRECLKCAGKEAVTSTTFRGFRGCVNTTRCACRCKGCWVEEGEEDGVCDSDGDDGVCGVRVLLYACVYRLSPTMGDCRLCAQCIRSWCLRPTCVYE